MDGARDLDPVVERVSNMILSLEPQARFRGRFPNNELRAVRDKILQRSTVGLKKYGVGLARDDLKKVDWLRHAQEEVMDLLNYIEALWYHGCIYWDDEGHGFHTQQLMLIHWAALFEQMIQREGG